MKFIKRYCPCCGYKEATPKINSSKKAENTSYPDLKKRWIGFFKEPLFFTYNTCDNCELLYNKIFFSKEKLSELYSSMPDNTSGQNLNNLRRTQRGYFNFLKTVNIPQGAYLEIGPDIGLFTENKFLIKISLTAT